MGSSGNFKSFNFGLNDDDYHQLANQEYSICIRRAKGRCKIAYQAANEGESFYTSQTPTTPAVRSKAGERGCRADYITIPNGSGSLSGGAQCQSDDTAPSNVPSVGRFCGRRLNCFDSSSSNTVIYRSDNRLIILTVNIRLWLNSVLFCHLSSEWMSTEEKLPLRITRTEASV